ncbi:MAG: hypothetical protein J5I90_05635 [Caldilineales bacterium]|nr:hypothetical protein [Caldilineales bacterium]
MATDSPLTPREAEILDLLAEGLSNDEIAARLTISPNTVKVHVRNIFEKMAVQSRTEATMEAVRRGWISVPGAASQTDNDAARPEPPSWPDLKYSWKPWQTVALVMAVAFALLMVFWPGKMRGVTAGVAADFTTEQGQQALTIAPRVDRARWTERAAMFTPRSRAAAGVIDGRLYVVGGETSSDDTDALEVYDPESDSWQSLPPRPIAARGAAAAGIDGNLYVAGGCSDHEPLDRLDRFDPQSGEWQQLASLPEPRCGLALVSYNGRLYAAGGWDGSQVTDSLFVYDIASDHWEEGRRLPAPRAFAGAAMLRDVIYLAGGHDGVSEQADLWAYDPATDSWQALESLPEARSGISLAAEGNSIYAIGGGEDGEDHLHERYNLTTGVWSTIDSPRTGPWRHSVAAIIGPNLHIVGGWAGDYLNSQEVYQASHLLFLPLGAQGSE